MRSDQLNPGDPPRLSDPEPTSERGHRMLELSNAVVRIHKQLVGKGPTKARSHLLQDLVVVLLEGGFTRGEQTLHDAGHDREVLQARMAMQYTAEDELRAVVERVLERRVRSFMSANDPTTGMQAEIFVLEPESAHAGGDAHDGGDISARAERARAQHRDILDDHRALRAEQAQSREALRREREDRS
jgi:uncharacterized protein YbcI